MPCYHPLTGYRARNINPSGKRSIVFDIKEGYEDLKVQVPCGRCIGCKLEKSRQWAIRCVHEASLYEKNCFVTLTYNDDNLPPDGSVNLDHVQKFLKRLRKKYSNEKIRYYLCAEYGERFSRPHYHICIFGFDFPDKVLFRTDERGTKLYRSASLETVWQFGFSTVGDVTFESAAYVARYVTKKLTGNKPFTYKRQNQKGGYDIVQYQNSDEHYERVNKQTGEITYLTKEFATMSRRPGIGKPWLEKYKTDVYPRDTIIIRGRKMMPPRYYDDFLEKEDFQTYQLIKRRRKAKNKLTTQERLDAMEQCKISKTKTLYRNYEKQQ